MPITAFRVVVLPAPLRPSKVATSPSATLKLMPCSTCDSPYHASRSRTSSRVRLAAIASGMTGSKIGLAHFDVLRDLAIGAFGENLTTRQHGDHVGEVGDHRQVRLANQHGGRLGNRAQRNGDGAEFS